MAFSVQRRISMWVFLELNFLCFTAILSKNFSIKTSNRAIHYFVVQALGSGAMLIIILVLIIKSFSYAKVFFFLFLIIKLGGAPIHMWYLKLVRKISWGLVWTLSVWQKIIPLLLLSLGGVNHMFFLILSSLRAFVGRITSLGQVNLKKIIGLSSIFSLGWLVLSIVLNQDLWLKFILGYRISLLVLLSVFIVSNLKSTLNLLNLSGGAVIVIFSGMLIIRGIPPFIIFFLKVLVLSYLTVVRPLMSILFLFLSIYLIFVYLMIRFYLLTFSNVKLQPSSLLKEKRFLAVDYLILNLGVCVLYVRFIFCN